MKKALHVVFWASISLAFLTPMELGDIWWHLKTGEWIWQHMALPEDDPFSIIPQATGGKNFVLTSSWLSQIFFYIICNFTGLYGLIAVKAIFFSLSFSLTYRLLKSYAIPLPLSYLLMLPAVFLTTFYDEIRPQTISFFFTSATFYLLEKHRPSNNCKDIKKSSYWLLPITMLLWSNTHGGFVIGVLMISAYVFSEAADKLLRPKMNFRTTETAGYSKVSPTLMKGDEGESGKNIRDSRQPRQPLTKINYNYWYFASCFLSIAVSAINPNGLTAIMLTKGMLMGSAAGSANIHEHLPAKEFASFTGEPVLYYGIIVFAVSGLVSFILNFRKTDFLHLAFFSGLAYASMVSFRAGLFFALIGTPLIGRNLSSANLSAQGFLQRVQGLSVRFKADSLTIAVLAALSLFMLFPRSILSLPLFNKDIFPLNSSDFIKNERLPANIYHPYEWGGYLMWKLFPEYRVFIDGRAIGPMLEYGEVWRAKSSWRQILRKYDVKTVLCWPLAPYKGRVAPIVFALIKDADWSPVYWDTNSIIFVEKSLAKNPIRKEAIWELFISLATSNIMKDPKNSNYYLALAEIYIEKGMWYNARETLKKALAVNAHDKAALFWLNSVERRLGN